MTNVQSDALSAVTFRSLRHLHASMLLVSGRGLQAVQRRLGRSSITKMSTDLYGHMIERAALADTEAATALIPAGSRRAAPGRAVPCRAETTRSHGVSEQSAGSAANSPLSRQHESQPEYEKTPIWREIGVSCTPSDLNREPTD